MSVMVRRNAENMALCPFHGDNRGSIPLGRAKEISSVTTSTQSSSNTWLRGSLKSPKMEQHLH